MSIQIKNINKNYIPDMIHPLSKGWFTQPKREDLLIDDKTVIMSEENFKMLVEYSTSVPYGAYEGKMWKAHKYEVIDGVKVWKWYLCWFGLSEKKGFVSNNMREIILL